MVLIDDISNFFMFYSFLGTGIMLLMVGRYYNLHSKFVSPWTFLSIGLMVVAFRGLFQSIPDVGGLGTYTPIIVPMVSILGSLLIVMGIGFILFQKRMEKTSLEKRVAEIKSVLENLHEKYFRKEISEDDMRRMNAELEKELAEIEVKLKGKNQI
jgi:uncharacterized membrane protein